MILATAAWQDQKNRGHAQIQSYGVPTQYALDQLHLATRPSFGQSGLALTVRPGLRHSTASRLQLEKKGSAGATQGLSPVYLCSGLTRLLNFGGGSNWRASVR